MKAMFFDKQDTQYTYNVTLMRLRIIIVVEKQ